MKQEERDLTQDESAGRETDTTRSQRRQAVSSEQTNNNQMGDGSEDGQGAEKGSHQEGQYSKQDNKPEVNK